MTNPKVSVCMVTYNHSAYIAQAIESVLTQETHFEVELVIGEDCSTDNTRTIIESYQKLYPTKIRLITSLKNVGAQPNFIRTYKACVGEYVAMLEGDDYWIDNLKLQNQVNILDNRIEAVMCFAQCAGVDEMGRLVSDNIVPEKYRRDLNQLDIVRDYCPPTLSTMYRNNVLSEFPDSFSTIDNGDYFLYSMLTEHGIAVYLPETVAHYREHSGGVWSSLDQEKRFRQNLRTKLEMLLYFKGRYQAEIMMSINWYYTQLGYLFKNQKRWREFWQLYKDFSWLSIRTFNNEFISFAIRVLGPNRWQRK